MKYVTASQLAAKWGLTVRQVQNMCSGGKLADAVRENRKWMIPEDVERPADRRVSNGKYVGWRKKRAEERMAKQAAQDR